MIIKVGSTNKTKIDSVTAGVESSALLAGANIVGCEISVPEFGHPIGLNKVIEGAMDRARQAFNEADLSVGMEGGMIEAPYTKSGYFEVTVCAIFDGKTFHLGMSPGFEWPAKAVKLIIEGGLDGSQAMREAGLTSEEKIGATGGAIGILTHGKLDRTEQNRSAFLMALIHLENEGHYKYEQK